MSEADDLARRYLALWGDYLTALVSDPKAAELLQRWVAFTNQFAPGHDGAGPPAFPWPPAAPARPADDAAAAAGAPGERDTAVGELARRLERIEQRLAALERQSLSRRAPPRRPPKRS